ncbi:pro-neuregulin-3, membrane-bound isoform [Chanos chanos]|uniref:Pro-neuregulin-3, membrane-bound isoform n=1 Tax=Chanos chanos TaxID=29144 RepID=A0A6J2VGJ4_CHACN|nr:pro-neuregulin-3, membrane-bound isoform-like [Chanos chanos]
MSERTALGSTMETLTLEEPGGDQESPQAPGPLRCGPCAVWPRQQTWLCVVPMLMGFVGLGLSLMLLKWIVVGSVQDYVPTDLVDAKGIEQDPIFLSKPSALPKAPDTTTTSTIGSGASVGPGSSTRSSDSTGTVQRTRLSQPSNHTASSSSNAGPGVGGPGNRAPHLHNRVGTRLTGTTTTTSTRSTRPAPPVGGKEATPRNTTIKKAGGVGNGHNASPSTRGATPSPTSTTSTSTTTISTPSTTSTRTTRPTSPLPPPTRPSQRWNHGRSSKGPSTKPTRPQHRFRTLAPTTSTLRSEFFRPCRESQDLAFCLNDGECHIIETVAGLHRHCRCKEGYKGLRCDQFVPKTDSILSDPTDELGIEFMESKENYQRQILSIFSIAMGISLLGVACMALYCRNKRQRQKHRVQLCEIRNLRDCTVNASGLMSKSTPRSECGLQTEKCCKVHGPSPPQGGRAATRASAAALSNHMTMGKHRRSCSLSSSPAQKHKVTNHRSASRWTPPTSRGRPNLLGGSRDSVHAYKHLQEAEPREATSESLRGFQSEIDGGAQSCVNMQILGSVQSRGKLEPADVPCTRLDQGSAQASPPSLRARSVPVITSAQGGDFGWGLMEGDDKATPTEGSGAVSHIVAENDSPESSSVPLAGLSEGAHTFAPCFEAALSPGPESKHKSLVTYTTALGSGTGPSRAKTIISTTVLGSGGPSTQYTARLLSRSTGRLEMQHVHSPVLIKAAPLLTQLHSDIRTGRDKTGQSGYQRYQSGISTAVRGIQLDCRRNQDGYSGLLSRPFPDTNGDISGSALPFRFCVPCSSGSCDTQAISSRVTCISQGSAVSSMRLRGDLLGSVFAMLFV